MQEKDKKIKAPNTLIATIEAQRKAAEGMKAAMQPSLGISEIMKEKHNCFKHLQKLAFPTAHLTEMAMGIAQHQQVFVDAARYLINDYTPLIQMANQFKHYNPMIETMKQYQQVFDSSRFIKNIIEEQHGTQKLAARFLKSSFQDEAQKLTARFLKSSFQVHNNRALEMSLINNWQDRFRLITESLGDFAPAVEMAKNALVIEEERFSEEDINQIAEEYIWDENSDKNIFKKDAKHLSWENIPKPVRCIIIFILVAFFNIYFPEIWKQATKDTALSPERVARQFEHFRKQEVRQISKNHQSEITPPFVSTEYLVVHMRPKRRSQTIAVLTYPCEVKILKLKKKNRWAFIEWEDESGKICQGWSLARYMYRKNAQKE